MKELAEQELKLLEAQYPTRFHYLKLHLKELIHLLDEEDQPPLINHQHQFHSSIITRESSSRRKRPRAEEHDEGCSKPEPKFKRPRKGEDAIHKAEACLHKIQTLKSLFFSSNH